MHKYSAKGFFIIGKDSKHLISFPNDVKLRIYVIDKPKTDFVTAKNTVISFVSDKINILNIQTNLHLIYQQDFYRDKQKERDDLFTE